MVETALLVRKQSLQRSGSVALVGCAICVESIYADFSRLMQIPSRFGEEGWNVAGSTLAFGFKNCLAARRCAGVKASLRRFRSRDCELVKMERRQLGRDQIRLVVEMSKLVLCRHGILLRIVEPRIKEHAFAVHFQIGHKRIPVSHCSPGTSPSVIVHSCQTKGRRNEYRG